MKTTLPLLLLVALFSFPVLAQEKGDVNFLPEAGLNISFPAGGDIYLVRKDFKEEKENNPDTDFYRPFRPRWGASAGFRIEYYILKKLAIGSGMIFNQKGWTEVSGVKYEDGYSRAKEKFRFDYIDFPFVAIVNFNGWQTYGGPVLSVLVFERVVQKQKTKMGDDVEKEEDKYDFYSSSWGDEKPRTITGGFQFGCRKQMSNGITCGVGFAYTTILPLTQEDSYELNTFQLQLTCGKVFQLRDRSTTTPASTKRNDAYIKSEAKAN